MAYQVTYRIDIPAGDFSAARAIVRRIVEACNGDRGNATMVTKSESRAQAYAALGSSEILDEQWEDGPTIYTIVLNRVAGAVLMHLLDAPRDDGFDLDWDCSRWWNDALLQGVSLTYNCYPLTTRWGLENGIFEFKLHVGLDHWPEEEARKVFTEVVGVGLECIVYQPE